MSACGHDVEHGRQRCSACSEWYCVSTRATPPVRGRCRECSLGDAAQGVVAVEPAGRFGFIPSVKLGGKAASDRANGSKILAHIWALGARAGLRGESEDACPYPYPSGGLGWAGHRARNRTWNDGREAALDLVSDEVTP